MILDGKKLSNEILDNITCDKKCKLVVISIGDNDASKVYVRNKRRAAERVGMDFENKVISPDADYLSISDYITKLNTNPSVRGIIIQLPVVSNRLSKKDVDNLINEIIPSKDVDGFGPYTDFIPCTPKGIMKLIETIPDYKFTGKTALVIGRSEIVGKPIANLLLEKNCTVMIAHSKTPKERLLRMFSFADIVVSAVGKTDLITEDDVYQYFKDNRHDFYGDFKNKRDRIIIDVGINRDENGKLCGDFSEYFKQQYSEHYTPVPGGVGPMTVAMLIENTYNSYLKSRYNLL